MTHANEPAYPVSYQTTEGTVESTLGLTKRECFAAMALQGMLSNAALAQHWNYDFRSLIQQSCYLADKLIDGLNDKL